MSTIHATMNVTLDGCCDHTAAVVDDEYHEKIADLFERFAGLLFGRTTYDLLHAYWPGVAASEEGTPGLVRLAHILDRLPKYVVSSSQLPSGWRAARIAPTQGAVRSACDAAGGDVLLVASPRLARTLLGWGVLDTYHVAVHPVLTGHGPYFLEGLGSILRPSLHHVDRLRSGVLLLRYDLGPSSPST
jgi:dihydrofolate reductase